MHILFNNKQHSEKRITQAQIVLNRRFPIANLLHISCSYEMQSKVDKWGV